LLSLHLSRARMHGVLGLLAATLISR
jgi:hypothetical protein